jgi:hypothetical protein
MEYDLRPLPRELSALSTHVFDPRLMPAGEVNIVTADTTAGSASLAGIVASGVARRFDYRRVSFTVSHALKPGIDNVVVGKRSFACRSRGRRRRPSARRCAAATSSCCRWWPPTGPRIRRTRSS